MENRNRKPRPARVGTSRQFPHRRPKKGFSKKAVLPQSTDSEGTSTNTSEEKRRAPKESQTESSRLGDVESRDSESVERDGRLAIENILSRIDSIQAGRTIDDTIFSTEPDLSARIPSEIGAVRRVQRSVRLLEEKVILLVGADAVPITTLKNVLSESSPFFQAAFKPEWWQEQEGILRLQDDCPDTISTLVTWTQGHHLRVPDSVLEFEKHLKANYDPLQTRIGHFVNLYLAADKYLMPQLRNDVIDGILVSTWNMGDMIKMSDYIYENTYPDSKMRKLLVQLVLHSSNTSNIWKLYQDFIGSEFRLELDVATAEKRERSRLCGYGYGFHLSPKVDFCKRFHIHSEGDDVVCTKLKDKVLEEISQ